MEYFLKDVLGGERKHLTVEADEVKKLLEKGDLGNIGFHLDIEDETSRNYAYTIAPGVEVLIPELHRYVERKHEVNTYSYFKYHFLDFRNIELFFGSFTSQDSINHLMAELASHDGNDTFKPYTYTEDMGAKVLKEHSRRTVIKRLRLWEENVTGTTEEIKALRQHVDVERYEFNPVALGIINSLKAIMELHPEEAERIQKAIQEYKGPSEGTTVRRSYESVDTYYSPPLNNLERLEDQWD